MERSAKLAERNLDLVATAINKVGNAFDNPEGSIPAVHAFASPNSAPQVISTAGERKAKRKDKKSRQKANKKAKKEAEAAVALAEAKEQATAMSATAKPRRSKYVNKRCSKGKLQPKPADLPVMPSGPTEATPPAVHAFASPNSAPQVISTAGERKAKRKDKKSRQKANKKAKKEADWQAFLDELQEAEAAVALAEAKEIAVKKFIQGSTKSVIRRKPNKPGKLTKRQCQQALLFSVLSSADEACASIPAVHLNACLHDAKQVIPTVEKKKPEAEGPNFQHVAGLHGMNPVHYSVLIGPEHLPIVPPSPCSPKSSKKNKRTMESREQARSPVSAINLGPGRCWKTTTEKGRTPTTGN